MRSSSRHLSQVLAGALAIVAGALGSVAPADARTDHAAQLRRADHALGSQVAKHEGGTRAWRTRTGPDTYRAAVAPSGGVLGIDVSGWQGEVDWQHWWNQGKRFAYVKATEGVTYQNPHYAQQFDGSFDVGLHRGAYHFALPDVSTGTMQANYFADNGGQWRRDDRTLPGVLDLEYNPYGETCYGKTPSAMVTWIKGFSDTFKQRTGRYPVIYTTTHWWKTCTGNSAAFAGTSPLWIARYNDTVGELPAGWSAYTFWQYSNDPIDQNQFNGTAASLRSLATNTSCMPRCRDRG